MAKRKQEPIIEDSGKEYQIIISGSSDYSDSTVISIYPTIELARRNYMNDVRKAKDDGKASGNHYAIREVNKKNPTDDKESGVGDNEES